MFSDTKAFVFFMYTSSCHQVPRAQPWILNPKLYYFDFAIVWSGNILVEVRFQPIFWLQLLGEMGWFHLKPAHLFLGGSWSIQQEGPSRARDRDCMDMYGRVHLGHERSLRGDLTLCWHSTFPGTNLAAKSKKTGMPRDASWALPASHRESREAGAWELLGGKPAVHLVKRQCLRNKHS